MVSSRHPLKSLLPSCLILVKKKQQPLLVNDEQKSLALARSNAYMKKLEVAGLIVEVTRQ